MFMKLDTIDKPIVIYVEKYTIRDWSAGYFTLIQIRHEFSKIVSEKNPLRF